MTANINIQYLTDKDGNKTAVIIPIKDWLNINKNLAEFLEFQALKNKLNTAFQDVEQIKKGKAKEVSLADFLDTL